MKLTKENYYSDKGYWSCSEVKRFLNCAASADEPFEPTSSMMVGSYVDAYFSGELEEFKTSHPEIINSRTGELKADFRHAEKMIKRVEADPLMVRMLTGRKQMIYTGTIAGYPFKAKLDIIQSKPIARKTAALFPDMNLAFADGAIVDLKTAKDFEPVWTGTAKESFLSANRYDMQLAIYQELVRQKTGKQLPCFIVAVTKETEPDIGVFSFEQSTLDSQLHKLESIMPSLDGQKRGSEPRNGCGTCGWCRRHKRLTEAIPAEFQGFI